MYNYISHPLLSPVHCENDHFDRVLRAPLQLCQLLEIVPRERVFTTLLIIVLLLCKVLPLVKLFTIFASVDKTKQENQKKYEDACQAYEDWLVYVERREEEERLVEEEKILREAWKPPWYPA